MKKTTDAGFYAFKVCKAQDYIYRIDFENGKHGQNDQEYLQLLLDYGWKLVYEDRFSGFRYFRKRAVAGMSEAEGELFSDDASKAIMASRLFFKRYLPILFVSIGLLYTNARDILNEGSNIFSSFSRLFNVLLFAFCLLLLIRPGVKLLLLRRRYKGCARFAAKIILKQYCAIR